MKRTRKYSLSDEAVSIMRQTTKEGLGFTCAFVDDEMKLLVVLAQRAVLAGLDADCQPDARRRFHEAAEKHRAGHETALGFAIVPQGAP